MIYTEFRTYTAGAFARGFPLFLSEREVRSGATDVAMEALPADFLSARGVRSGAADVAMAALPADFLSAWGVRSGAAVRGLEPFRKIETMLYEPCDPEPCETRDPLSLDRTIRRRAGTGKRDRNADP